MRRDSQLTLLVPLFPIFLLGMLPMLVFPLLGFAGLAVIGVLVIRSDQGRHLSSLKSASRLAKGLTAAGVGIASIAIIGLYWN